MASLKQIFPVFLDTDGKPLDNGQVFIGNAGFEARTSPKASFFDPAMTIPTGTATGAAITTSGGYAIRAGAPAQVYVDPDYSITVLNAADELVFSTLSAASSEASVDVALGNLRRLFATVPLLLADNTLNYGTGANGVSVGDIIEADVFHYRVAPSGSSTATRVTTLGGVILDVLPGRNNALYARAFGANPDGVTDTTAALTKFVAAVKALADTGLHPSGVFDGDFFLASSLNLNADYTHWYFNGSLRASGSWGGVAPMLQVSAVHADLIGPVLDGNKIAHGIRVTGGNINIHDPYIENFKGIGIDLDGAIAGDNIVHNPNIFEYRSSDPEFNTDINYTSTGIRFNRPDDRVFGGIVRWCRRCVVFEAAATTSWLRGTQIYNGRPPVSGVDTPRTNSVMIENYGFANVVQDCYLNNGHIDVYAQGFSLVNCQLICNTGRVTYADSAIIRVFATPDNSPFGFELDQCANPVRPTGVELIKYLPNSPNTWSGTYTGIDTQTAYRRLVAHAGVTEVYHIFADGSPARILHKPAGTILNQYKIGTATPVDESYTGSSKVTRADTYRVQSATGSEARVYLGANITGLAEDGSNNLLTRTNGTLRLEVRNSDGAFRPGADNTQNLGESGRRWATVFAGTGTINTSDEREKQDIERVSAALVRVGRRLRKSLKTFRYRDAVALKGDGARVHIGLVAQDVIAAFEAEGLDPFAYGCVCYDEWDAEEEVWETGEDGIPQLLRPATPAGSRYGLRHDQINMLMMAAVG